MTLRFFSDRNRPVHLGPYPMERLRRLDAPDLRGIPEPLPLKVPNQGLAAAMADHQAMMDAIRDGLVNRVRAACPDDDETRARHLKAFGYFNDADMVGICRLPTAAHLAQPWRNPGIDRLAQDLRTKQTKTLASGIDMIMADLKDSMEAPPSTIDGHTHAVVFLSAQPRDPWPGEAGTEALRGAGPAAAALRASETAVVLANYLRLLGFDAKAHTQTSSDVDLNRLAVEAGLAVAEHGEMSAPFLGQHFGLAALTTTFAMSPDRPLARYQPSLGPRWWLGWGTTKGALNRDPFARRRFADGPHPFETLKRVDDPTTYIDEPRVPRVPKRADMFARAQFGDLGKAVQEGAKGGHYARKAPTAAAERRMLGAFVLLQDGPPSDGPRPEDADDNAAAIKAAAYFLGIDAVGISRCPDWTWYSHDAAGHPIYPPHPMAISMIVDQGFETMEGASGDDWISVAQSMRAYLRFSLLGGVIASHIRRLGYSAKAHTVLDGEVLQPPLLLLSGLGEVSRIGEVILNPFLGPRLKSGVVTTDMPLAVDRPIDFGLQRFCEACNKCARECPSGAITAGPKKMFNGYEIWKSDSQKCATYRITTKGGAMCGRCMKTCPWNLEGLFAERPFRWMASNLPSLAPTLAALDDRLGRGGLNPVKKWWWDLELEDDGGYRPTRHPVNARDLQPELEIRPEDQTLAVYPAPLTPPPWPYPFPMDREAGIQAYRALLSPDEHRSAIARGDDVAHRVPDFVDSPVVEAVVSKVDRMTDAIAKYELRAVDGSDLPAWTAGAHVDVVVAPEFLRQYSLSGDPADRSVYQVAVLREDGGRGGSRLMHRIFGEGRRVFLSKPVNHFPLVEEAPVTLLFGGGIGVTPMIAMAHRLHVLGRAFRLHYSVPSRASAGFLADLAAVPWADRVTLHVSSEGTRADLGGLLSGPSDGTQVYVCGPERYISAVTSAASAAGWPEEAVHIEYFALPEERDYENHPFTLRLVRSARDVAVPADRSAAEALLEAGVRVDLKCSDGLCGVCRCGLVSGEVEHRDFVLAAAERKVSMILCRSRAAAPEGVVEIDL